MTTWQKMRAAPIASVREAFHLPCVSVSAAVLWKDAGHSMVVGAATLLGTGVIVMLGVAVADRCARAKRGDDEGADEELHLTSHTSTKHEYG